MRESMRVETQRRNESEWCATCNNELKSRAAQPCLLLAVWWRRSVCDETRKMVNYS